MKTRRVITPAFIIIASATLLFGATFFIYNYAHRSFRAKAHLLKSGEISKEEVYRIMGCPPGDYGFKAYGIPRGLLNESLKPNSDVIDEWADNECKVMVYYLNDHVHRVYIVEPYPEEWGENSIFPQCSTVR